MKRAISPVVATLILIIVAVVAGVATYGFVTGFIAQTTTQSQSPSNIVIDAASISASAGTGTLVVRNVGQESATVVAVYILDSGDLHLIDEATITSTSVSPGSAVSISMSGISGVSANQWVIVKAVTDDGSSATLKIKVSS